MQKTAYKGTDLMLLAMPKFFADTRIAYFELKRRTYSFRLVALTLSELFTSIV